MSTTRHSPLELIWGNPASILWMMLFGEGVALILTLALGVDDAFRYFAVLSLAAQSVLLATIAMLYLLREQLRGLPPVRLAQIALVLLLASSVALAMFTRFTFEPIVSLPVDAWGTLLWRMVAIVAVVGLLGLAAFHNHWRGRLNAIRAKQSELQSLQARIRPHFLFNTLNTGAALVHERPEEAERLLLDLSDLFRAALAGPRKIPLAEELGLARRYLEIEQLRFGERLHVRWELPREIPPVSVPALSIQPLVENAVRHGAERMAQADIEIAVSTTPDTVVVRISNPLPPPAPGGHDGHRVGLHASQARIEALTGGRGSVRTEVVGGRFVATVRLPVGGD